MVDARSKVVDARSNAVDARSKVSRHTVDARAKVSRKSIPHRAEAFIESRRQDLHKSYRELIKGTAV